MIRVILADDHAIMRDGLRSILENHADIKVVADVGDGQQAITSCSKLKPDVILMDIHMPPFDGIEATRKIRQDYPGVQVVILSMHANKEFVYQALKAGARGYLVKETSGSEVVDAIRMVDAGKRFLSNSITAAVIDDYIQQREPLADADPLERLSNQERYVLQFVVNGRSSREIAETLSLSTSTVNTYRSRLMRKLGVRDMPALVRFAIEHNLFPLNVK
jgi:DNA-binding NarL/FixJ family response regulator